MPLLGIVIYSLLILIILIFFGSFGQETMDGDDFGMPSDRNVSSDDD